MHLLRNSCGNVKFESYAAISLSRSVHILNLIQSPDITSHARIIERSKAEKWYNRRQRASWYTWKYIRELNRVKWKRALRYATYKIRRQVKDLRKSRVTWLLSRLIYKYHVWLSNESHYLPSFRFLSFLFFFSLFLSFWKNVSNRTTKTFDTPTKPKLIKIKSNRHYYDISSDSDVQRQLVTNVTGPNRISLFIGLHSLLTFLKSVY